MRVFRLSGLYCRRSSVLFPAEAAEEEEAAEGVEGRREKETQSSVLG